MDHDADMADSLTIAVAALQQAATGMVASGELRILGKVPEEASSAAAAMHDQHQELCQHISALQQCLLPCSSSIVSSIVAYLEHTTADRVLFIRLTESGELSKQCKGFAHALSSAQDGYEALGSELLGLQQTLDKTHKKVLLDLAAAREYLDGKLARRNLACKAGPGAAGAATAAAAGAAVGVAFMLFPPAILLAPLAPLAGWWAREEAEEIAADSFDRAQQQQDRTEGIASYCDATNKELHQVINLVGAVNCTEALAGFFGSLAAAADRAGSTAAQMADTQHRACDALRKVLLRQVHSVTAAGASFKAAVKQLSTAAHSQQCTDAAETSLRNIGSC